MPKITRWRGGLKEGNRREVDMTEGSFNTDYDIIDRNPLNHSIQEDNLPNKWTFSHNPVTDLQEIYVRTEEGEELVQIIGGSVHTDRLLLDTYGAIRYEDTNRQQFADIVGYNSAIGGVYIGDAVNNYDIDLLGPLVTSTPFEEFEWSVVSSGTDISQTVDMDNPITFTLTTPNYDGPDNIRVIAKMRLFFEEEIDDIKSLRLTVYRDGLVVASEPSVLDYNRGRSIEFITVDEGMGVIVTLTHPLPLYSNTTYVFEIASLTGISVLGTMNTEGPTPFFMPASEIYSARFRRKPLAQKTFDAEWAVIHLEDTVPNTLHIPECGILTNANGIPYLFNN